MNTETEAISLVINEGALNDDELLVAAKGQHFGNNRTWVYAVRYWTYANGWCNRDHIFYVKSLDNALRRYKRETGRGVTDETYDSLSVCAGDFRDE